MTWVHYLKLKDFSRMETEKGKSGKGKKKLKIK